jgi:uncharacterized protein (TIGR03067 family)
MGRVVTALLAVCVLTAFAPAPFPKPPRRGGEEINLQGFQGTWRSVKLEGIEQNGGKREIPWGIAAVRVQNDLWTFLNKGETENAKYRLVIDGTRKPPTIDFYSEGRGGREQGGKPYMVGVMKRQGDIVQILYFSTGPENRARSFDNPPVGWWLLTLERRK